MKKLVNVGVSNRHVHLTEEVYNLLFKEKMEKRNDLSQPGDFASNQVVTLKTEKSSISNVRIIGPFRTYNQVEISRSDAYQLGIHPPVRRSGDLENSETVTIVGTNGEITLENVCILSERHVHMNEEDAISLGVSDKQIVKVYVTGDKSCILDAHVKVTKNGRLAFHIDYDDANATGLKEQDKVEIEF